MDKQLFVGSEPKKEKINPIQNHVINKPYGGLWTSTYKNGTSRWIEWCNDSDFFRHDLSVRYTLEVSDKAKIYHVRCYNDLKYLFDRFILDKESRILHELNYVEISKYYDAIHLTDQGLLECHLSHPYNLYGWDCECTFWFRWCFTSVEKVEGVIHD